MKSWIMYIVHCTCRIDRTMYYINKMYYYEVPPLTAGCTAGLG